MSDGSKGGFRKAMTPVHTWGGLVLGWVMFFIFVTGTLGYFDTEIDRWTRPEVPRQQMSVEQAVETAVTRLSAVAPNADHWTIGPPGSRDFPNLYISWRSKDVPQDQGTLNEELLNADTLMPYPQRDTRGGQALYRMHYNLHYMSKMAGRYLVGVASMFMLVAIITGIVIHKKIFKDFFTFRPQKGQRSWLDMHNMLSVLALPFHLMITYSGLLFFVFLYMPAIMLATYGSGEQAQEQFAEEMFPRDHIERAGQVAPLAPLLPMVARANARWGAEQIKYITVDFPGDVNARVTINRRSNSVLRVSDALVFNGVSGELIKDKTDTLRPTLMVFFTMLGLHEGAFADTPLRWLYFLSGIMGSVMIATGLVLWSVKRSARRSRQKQPPGCGHRLVEVLNIGTIIGLPVGIAAFFWANRLLPPGLEQRADWEIHMLFIAWLGMLTFAALRPASRAWTEALWIGAAAFALIPLLNALTTNRHLGHSLAAGDWVFAGIDLTMLATGGGFAVAAWIRQRRDAQTEANTQTTRRVALSRVQ